LSDALIAERTEVCQRFPVNGGMLVGVQPTGNTFEVQHIHMYRVLDGKIAEHFANRDDVGMMRQLDLLPPPPLLSSQQAGRFQQSEEGHVRARTASSSRFLRVGSPGLRLDNRHHSAAKA